jgi:hypothetical protein
MSTGTLVVPVLICGARRKIEPAGSTTKLPVDVRLDAVAACVKGGPSTQFNIAATDGRTAEAMRDRHIPAASTTNAQLLQLFLFD